MQFFEIMLIAVGLAMDAFSVSVGAGMTIQKVNFGHYFRLSFHFGLFQFFMPIIGYFVGRQIGAIIGDYDHWVAFVLLSFIGSKMIYTSLFQSHDDVELTKGDPSRGLNLVLLSIATSIDALAVGISLGVIGCDILFPSIVIGVVCAAFSIIGIFLGKRIGMLVGKRAEIFGGFILIAIGAKIVFDHLIV
ncbi:MAG: manganese efflux pump MntP family protein [Spirochaetes bacterium]|nr:manganese efflux pump MntP family protein [Spirochaetota bacterium]